MAQDWESIAGLLAGTVLLRPYVFVFLLAFLVVAGRDLGVRRATVWLCWGWMVAFVAEYSSTRTGIPFGLYHYTGSTAGQELFISNGPSASLAWSRDWLRTPCFLPAIRQPRSNCSTAWPKNKNPTARVLQAVGF